VIVVDTSAVIAILLREPGSDAISDRLLSDTDGVRFMSPVSVVESIMVLSRTYSQPKAAIDAYLNGAGIVISPIDAAQMQWASHAFLFFGKGRHPARLNLGDCFSYAVAKALNAPLLFVGGDFGKTDIRAA
jgi:ribonuclease VapC